MRVLLLGVSTRSLAESAAAAGHEVVAVDYFGDRDQASVAESRALDRDLGLPLSPEGLGAAAGLFSADAIVYGAGLENHPAVVRSIGRRQVVLGNDPSVLRRVRDWHVLARVCREEGIPHPAVLFPGEEAEALAAGRWLSKPVGGGGGLGIRRWAGERLDDNRILQAEVAGSAVSAAFVADGREGRVFALTEQLVGRSEFGAPPFAWSGNILSFEGAVGDGSLLVRRVEDLVGRLVRRFGLRGVNGVDLVVRSERGDGPRPYLLEVNPRPSGSMELAERAYGLNVFSLHIEGLAGRLPDFSLIERMRTDFFGKAIVYARRTAYAACTDGWVERGMRDVPISGQRIEAGHPICTVFAHESRRRACFDRLATLAASCHAEMESAREVCLE